MGQTTLTIEQATNQAINDYFSKNTVNCQKIVKLILDSDGNQLISNYLQALLLYKNKNHNEGKQLMLAIEQAYPQFLGFDYKNGLLEQQGNSDWLILKENRLKEFCYINSIDNFIISFPKCGRTWLRMMLGKYLLNDQEGDPIELLQLTQKMPNVPNTELSHDDYPMWKHIDKMFEDKSIYSDKKVVWLTRDPRDAFVSYYFQHTKRHDGKRANDSFNGSMKDFLTHPIGGLPSIIKFYNIWAKNLRTPKAMYVLSYEKIHQDPFDTMKSLIEFLNFPDFGDQAIQKAVDYCQFDNMKKIERENLINNPRLQSTNVSDPEAFKVRKGKVGGYTEYLTPEEIDFMEQYILENLDPFYANLGYL